MIGQCIGHRSHARPPFFRSNASFHVPMTFGMDSLNGKIRRNPQHRIGEGGVPARLRAMQKDEGNHMRSIMGRASREVQVTHTTCTWWCLLRLLPVFFSNAPRPLFLLGIYLFVYFFLCIREELRVCIMYVDSLHITPRKDSLANQVVARQAK